MCTLYVYMCACAWVSNILTVAAIVKWQHISHLLCSHHLDDAKQKAKYWINANCLADERMNYVGNSYHLYINSPLETRCSLQSLSTLNNWLLWQICVLLNFTWSGLMWSVIPAFADFHFARKTSLPLLFLFIIACQQQHRHRRRRRHHCHNQPLYCSSRPLAPLLRPIFGLLIIYSCVHVCIFLWVCVWTNE